MEILGKESEKNIGFIGLGIMGRPMTYPVDIHSPTGSDGGCTDEYATANAYEIPYRSLVPVELSNLLVAGRCISASHEALSAVRVMPPCFAMGQAAGIAAALCAELSLAPRNINVILLQQELLKQDAYLGPRVTTLLD